MTKLIFAFYPDQKAFLLLFYQLFEGRDEKVGEEIFRII